MTTFYDSKRLFGMKMTDEEIINNLNSWPFDLTNDEDNNPIYVPSNV